MVAINLAVIQFLCKPYQLLYVTWCAALVLLPTYIMVLSAFPLKSEHMTHALSKT